MTKVLLTESYLENIADAIRAKNGTQDTYTPGEMSEAINALEVLQPWDILSKYFTPTISAGSSGNEGWRKVYRGVIPDGLSLPNGATSCAYLFRGYTGSEIDLSNIKVTNKITSLDRMFSGCQNVTDLDVSNWDTSNVRLFGLMFCDCYKLKSLDLTKWDTSNATDMVQMFVTCKSITELDLSSFTTTKVTNMSGMFRSCTSLQELDLSSFNTSNVTNMIGMFDYCTSLTKLDIRNFDFSKVGSNWSNMFGTDATTGVPDNCLIIVKDNTVKNWITGNFPRLTNVQTVAEYEASQAGE